MMPPSFPKHAVIALLALTLTGPGMVIAAESQPSAAEEALIAGLGVGRAQWLDAAGDAFLGVYTEANSGEPQGGIILLHGLGAHPDWPAVIHPLRRGLPDYGWATLSIQVPQPAQNADREWELAPVFEHGAARVAVAVALLEQQGLQNIVVIGHGLGAAVLSRTLAGVKNGKVKAFVAVGLGLPSHNMKGLYEPDVFEQIEVPVLDIYGSRDIDAVIAQAPARARAARKGGAATYRSQHLDPLRRSATARIPMSEQSGYIAYRQIEITGADHYFTGNESTLVKRIAGWLKKHAAGAAVRETRPASS